MRTCLKCKKKLDDSNFYASWCHCCLECTDKVKRQQEELKINNTPGPSYSVKFNQWRNG